MKKLLKLLGLLLLAGVLFAGCGNASGNPETPSSDSTENQTENKTDNPGTTTENELTITLEDASKIEFSDGTWEITSTSTLTNTYEKNSDITEIKISKTKTILKINGDKKTPVEESGSFINIYEAPASYTNEQIEELRETLIKNDKAVAEAAEDDALKIDGNKITITEPSGELSAEDIAYYEQHPEDYHNDIFENTASLDNLEIKTNSAKTQYKATGTVDYNEPKGGWQGTAQVEVIYTKK